MKRFLVFGLISLMVSSPVFAKENNIQSTEGTELNAKAVKNATKTHDKEQKQLKKKRKKFIKNISKIEKMEKSKNTKERNLEFLKQRLEIKQYKLQELTEDEEKKKGAI